MFGGDRCANVYSCPSSTFLVEFLVQLGVTLSIFQWKAASVSPSSAVLIIWLHLRCFLPNFWWKMTRLTCQGGNKEKWLLFEQDEVSRVDLQGLLVVVVVQVECAEMGDAGNGEVFVSDVLQLGCTWNCKITG